MLFVNNPSDKLRMRGHEYWTHIVLVKLYKTVFNLLKFIKVEKKLLDLKTRMTFRVTVLAYLVNQVNP